MRNLLKTTIYILIIAISAVAQQQSKPPLVSSAVIFPGGFLSYSIRDGYREYEGMRELEHIERKNLVMYGVFGGKRFALSNQRLRTQASIELGWGSMIDDIYKNVPAIMYDPVTKESEETALDISIHDNLFTAGIQYDLHFLLSSTGKHSYFLSLGPGVGWSSLTREGKTDFGRRFTETVIINAISFNLNIGAGIDYMINRSRAVSLSYNFRFWGPIIYDEVNLFPMGKVEYHEVFFTHMIQAQILILPQRSKQH